MKNKITLEWWNGLEETLKLAFYAHIRLWKEKDILVNESFLHSSQIYHMSNILRIYQGYFGEELEDISPDINMDHTIENIIKIPFLCLQHLEITNISALSSFTQLIELSLNDNLISNISALKSLTQLTKLNLMKNKISNISVLEKLTQLIELNLGLNNISDISFLKKLTKLTTLNFIHNDVSNIFPLQNLIQLKWLRFASNHISDISALEGLTQLTHLDLRDNYRISDISMLNKLTQLRQLRLYNDNIQIPIPDSQIEELIKALPNLSITW